MIYYFDAIGRTIGSIGITYPFCEEVKADSYSEAVLELYKKWEHITIKRHSEWKENKHEDENESVA